MSVSVRTFLAGSVLEVSVFLLIEMDEIGLVAPEVPEDPAPGSEPKEPKDKQYNKEGQPQYNPRGSSAPKSKIYKQNCGRSHNVP